MMMVAKSAHAYIKGRAITETATIEMLFATAVLFVMLITAGAQEQECHLAKWLKAMYIKFIGEALQTYILEYVPRPLVKWNTTMSDLALQEAIVDGSVQKDLAHPYVKLQREKEFRKIDRLSLKEKVRKILKTLKNDELLLPYGIDHIGGNAYFGCNGHEEEKGDKEYMKIVCLVERRLWLIDDDGTVRPSPSNPFN
ncbi:hypothetical protein GCK32_017153 [Trichostrongylus colubriformis]|uniref:Uncharacterized protein n=1 Tax=Trichostrongylus colubriformis TaxID=6319 RepID=A0AAN8IBR8_TRICO